ncbi:MerR family transcriptional regulator [Erysipelothrix larvae]|nr:MerR family transcriptional regulator [Erysipelothrix larvae]
MKIKNEMENLMNYSIGAFSKKVNLSIDTLRYYEKEKLILPKRNESNRRVYSESDVAWIEFIMRLKQIGMPIKDIQHYANLRDQGDETIEDRMQLLYKQSDILEVKKREIDANIQFLNQKIDTYKRMLADKKEAL